MEYSKWQERGKVLLPLRTVFTCRDAWPSALPVKVLIAVEHTPRGAALHARVVLKPPHHAQVLMHAELLSLFRVLLCTQLAVGGAWGFPQALSGAVRLRPVKTLHLDIRPKPT